MRVGTLSSLHRILPEVKKEGFPFGKSFPSAVIVPWIHPPGWSGALPLHESSPWEKKEKGEWKERDAPFSAEAACWQGEGSLRRGAGAGFGTDCLGLGFRPDQSDHLKTVSIKTGCVYCVFVNWVGM